MKSLDELKEEHSGKIRWVKEGRQFIKLDNISRLVDAAIVERCKKEESNG